MKPISSFRFFKMTWLDKPAHDRAIYKLIKERSVRSIVEIGLGDGTRAVNMIGVADKFGDARPRYTGVDMFDAREDDTPLKLIEMHKRLKNVEAKTQLVPGDLSSAIPRIANSHLRTDLIIISAGFDPEALARAQTFLPRMLHASSTVLIQRKQDSAFKILSRLAIEKNAAVATPKRKAA